MNNINLIKLYIDQDYRILLGKPHIKGTRLSVEIILRKMAEGASIVDLTEMYPGLTIDQLHACLEYAASVVSNDEILEVA